jgi:hypothetical protein
VAGAAWWLVRPAPPPPLPVQSILAASRLFSAEPGLQLAPRFSADARRVAFALAEGDESRIVVQALDGSSRRFIGAEQGVRVSPVFFPDGRRIAYWQQAEGACGIYERDLQTDLERRLVDCAMLPRVRFDIAPDGGAIVFSGSASADAPAGLWLQPVGGGAPRRLTLPPAGAADDLHPRFSADGRSVAFFRGREGLRQPWIASVDGQAAPQAAGRECGRCYGLAWLPAGAGLLVAGDWYGQPGLRVLAGGGEPEHAVGAPGARFPDVSARGDLVYERAREPRSGSRIEPAANTHAETAEQIDLLIARR